MRYTPLIFYRLYRNYRYHGHSCRVSLREAWRTVQHRIH
ncbi:MAG: hypothetical protein RLZZ22_147 [Pseudomonadota bacterium]|jgi:hypothetical protein